MKEKNKIIIHRLSWLFVVVLIIFLPILIDGIKPKLYIVDDEGYINDYYYALDKTSVTIRITFNREVDSGYATVKYYNSSNHLLETKRSYFTSYGGRVAECYSLYINGAVASYEIVSFEFDSTFAGWVIYYLLFPAILMFIASLLICYREYDYNGKKLSVYAGLYHHTLRVDGVKCDEHNTVMSFTPLKLSTTLDDGTKLEATISLTNRVSLKINDKLVTK